MSEYIHACIYTHKCILKCVHEKKNLWITVVVVDQGMMACMVVPLTSIAHTLSIAQFRP